MPRVTTSKLKTGDCYYLAWRPEILLGTRLVAYYLTLGLEVTRIYQCIEYVAKSVFIPFVDDVTCQRKMADKHPDGSWETSTNLLVGD